LCQGFYAFYIKGLLAVVKVVYINVLVKQQAIRITLLV